MAIGPNKIAIWIVTPNGLALAAKLRRQWPEVTIYCPQLLADDGRSLSAKPFDRLIGKVAERFDQFDGHIFIMAAGIVVRAIGRLLQHKGVDPAVVVVDDKATFAISLVSGHIGGANQLASQIAELLGATPVITTATDVNHRPAIDTMAVDRDLVIENLQAVKGVNMALLSGRKILLYDPHGVFGDDLADYARPLGDEELTSLPQDQPVVYVDDRLMNLPGSALILRPRSLAAGIGCNRNTPEEEIRSFLQDVMAANGLCVHSLRRLASIDVKTDEPGLLAAAKNLGIPLQFYSREELNQVRHVPNPSHVVAKHVGVKSVCEAAAVLAAKQGYLIVPKKKTTNVTVAIARRSFSSSESVREV